MPGGDINKGPAKDRFGSVGPVIAPVTYMASALRLKIVINMRRINMYLKQLSTDRFLDALSILLSHLHCGLIYPEKNPNILTTIS